MLPPHSPSCPSFSSFSSSRERLPSRHSSFSRFLLLFFLLLLLTSSPVIVALVLERWCVVRLRGGRGEFFETTFLISPSIRVKKCLLFLSLHLFRPPKKKSNERILQCFSHPHSSSRACASIRAAHRYEAVKQEEEESRDAFASKMAFLFRCFLSTATTESALE